VSHLRGLIDWNSALGLCPNGPFEGPFAFKGSDLVGPGCPASERDCSPLSRIVTEGVHR
jgi:hypothetical protein